MHLNTGSGGRPEGALASEKMLLDISGLSKLFMRVYRMKRLLPLLILMLLSSTSFAQKTGNARKLQFRVLLGQSLSKPTDFNEQIQTISALTPAVEGIKFNSIDLLWVFDSGLLLGTRYDIIDHAGAKSSVETKLKAERADLLAGWRFWRFEKGYLGLVGHVALGANKFTFDTKNYLNSATNLNLQATVEQGYGIGIEAAFFLEKQFPIGLEIGYTSWKTKQFTDASGAIVRDSSAKDLQMDLSGPYVKMAIGFTFF